MERSTMLINDELTIQNMTKYECNSPWCWCAFLLGFGLPGYCRSGKHVWVRVPLWVTPSRMWIRDVHTLSIRAWRRKIKSFFVEPSLPDDAAGNSGGSFGGIRNPWGFRWRRGSGEDTGSDAAAQGRRNHAQRTSDLVHLLSTICVIWLHSWSYTWPP